ncbi:MAG: GNAT family N-acetyltransferase, partial [Candidatus Portnoybacteria bacterium]|nr:GNAT family N-acetyltransferase [Candidatus Portnoybacteria bacterium]
MIKKAEFLIKEASLKDLSEIVAIHKSCVLETNARFYSKDIINEWLDQISEKSTREQFKNSSWYILKINSKIIGFTQFSIKDKILYQINISPKYQRKNYGRYLYNFVEKKFKNNKIKKISLNSTLNAFKFYKSLGFRSLNKTRFKLKKEYV